MTDPAEAARKRRHRNERIAAAILVLLAAAAALWTVRFKREREAAALADRTYIPPPDRITPEVLLLRDYVRIDTSTPEGQARGARWLAAELAKRGIEAELIESSAGHLNVYARIKGRQAGEGLLLFNHIDVVPPGRGWTQPPFDGKVFQGEMYGRGTLDMKSIAIAQLLAFADIARSGRPPAHDLAFLATADEEKGSKHGMVWLLEHRPDLFEGLRYGLTEGGLTEVMTERITYFGIEVGGKQNVTLELRGRDLESLRQARFKLQRFVVRRQPDRVLPEVRRYFRDIAATRVTNRQYLEDIDRTIAGGEFWRLPASYSDLTRDSIAVSAPYERDGRFLMWVTMTNLPDTDPDQRLEWIRREVAGYGVTIHEIYQRNGPVPLSTSDTALFRILSEQAARQYRAPSGVQVLFRSMNDSRFLRQRGMVCYGVSPFLVSYFQSTTIHQSNERIRLDWYEQGLVYVREIVRAWAAS